MALSGEQRKQVFGAAFNAFLRDLERQTGYTIAPDVIFAKKGRVFGTYDLILTVVPLEGWEPESEVVDEKPDEK